MNTPYMPSMGPSTHAVHAGQGVDSRTLPIPPLVLNSAILLRSVDEGLAMLSDESDESDENIAYQRYANPTVSLMERKFCGQEGSRYGLAINSGMSACYLVFRALLRAGDHILAIHSLYHEISDQLLADQAGCGVECSFVEEYGIERFSAALRANTRMIFIESPTNPALLDVDIPELAKMCRQHAIMLVVDNTLLTHYGQRPLDLGADIAIYSTTKAINGHGDAVGGIITTNDAVLIGKIKSWRDNLGLIIDPFSAWLTIRGLRTIGIRQERQDQNAVAVGDFLRREFPHYRLIDPRDGKHNAANGVDGYGGILSLVLDGREQGTRFIRGLRLFKIGTTFGNLESLVYHFGTFARPSRDITRIGIPLGLVRLSLGIEDAADLIADLRQALAALSGSRAPGSPGAAGSRGSPQPSA